MLQCSRISSAERPREIWHLAPMGTTAAARGPAWEGSVGSGGGRLVSGRRSTSLEASTTAGGGGGGRGGGGDCDKKAAKGRRRSPDDDKGAVITTTTANSGNAAALLRGGRKSVSDVESGGSRLQLDCVAAFLGVKVLAADMPVLMQVHAFRCARRSLDAVEKISTRQVAHDIKKEFDKVHGPLWHCVAGSSFGSFVTHSAGRFLYFSIDKMIIMLFKTRDPRSPPSSSSSIRPSPCV